MRNRDLNKFERQLTALKAALELTQDEYDEAGKTVELDQTRVGRVSRMDAMQTQQMALEQSRRRLQQIQKVEGALRRVEAGEYGSCFICGEPINLHRLEADPTSTRCIGCVGED